MVRTYEKGLIDFWQHPRFIPQEIADELGVDASEMFRLHGLLALTIMEANPTQVLTDVASLGTFVINEDGTVTAARI